ncbi:MAG TPA: hypothetical protein PKJ63_14435 [Cyclobacteriaceae bacterium]|nr:hypothetical protein [Cyclobacteriaceae bacterium]
METSNPEKRRLLQTSERHRQEIENEVKSISKSAEKALTNALFIGGALALTYLVVSQVTGSKARKKKKKQSEAEDQEAEHQEAAPSFLSHVGEIIVTQATMTLLELAKDRLSDYLQKRQSTDDNS